MAAAVSAARAGAEAVLLEARPRLGGTVAHCLIHTIGGLFDDAGERINPGLASELIGRLIDAGAAHGKRKLGRAWVLDVCPAAYQAVTECWLTAEPRVVVRTGTAIHGVWTTGDRLDAVDAADGDRIEADAVIDCTGTAEVVRQVDPALLRDEPEGAAGGIICRVRGVDPAVREFPRSIQAVRALQRAGEDGGLHRTCAKAWIDRGIHADEVFVKLMVPVPSDWREREVLGGITAEARAVQTAVLDFLQRLPGYSAAQVTTVGELGIRDGGRVHGDYCLTADDVRRARKFADAACRAGWPIEYWDPEHGVKLEYLPAGSYYQVPLRSLRVRGFANLWVAGKCLSADRLAQASARVVGTCWAMGEAAGRAAAAAMRTP